MASTNSLVESAPIEMKEADERERQQFVGAALGLISGPLTESVNGISPANQGEIDEHVW